MDIAGVQKASNEYGKPPPYLATYDSQLICSSQKKAVATEGGPGSTS
jgi:hypothetical protein